jgi:hypothetical protein
MTARRALAGLLARAFPGRGRHRRDPLPEETLVLPRVRDDDQGQADEMTRSDVSRVRPYVPPGAEDGFRWLP